MESSSAYTSLSTGCFVSKPDRYKRDMLDLPCIYKEEEHDSRSRRYVWFQKTFSMIEHAVEDVMKSYRTTVSNKIVELINCHKFEGHLETLTVKVGENWYYYAPLYKKLIQELENSHQYSCVVLELAHGVTDISNLLKSILSQSLCDGCTKGKVLNKILSLSGIFKVLEDEGKKGLVVCIPRFEKLPAGDMEVLLSLLLATQSKDFPVFLVLGLSTGSEISSEYMSNKLMCSLRVTNLPLPTPTALLENILLSTILDPKFPFKLSYRTFEVLLSRFSLSTYSIKEVMKTLKVAILSHAMHQPLVNLINMDEMDLNTSNMTNIEKNLILQLPSMQRCVEKTVVSDKELATKLLQGDNLYLTKLFDEVNGNYITLFYTFKAVHKFIKDIPGNKLVSKPLELFSFFLQGNLCKIPEVTMAFRYFGMLQPGEFLHRLQDGYKEIKMLPDTSNLIQLLGQVIKCQIDKYLQSSDEYLIKNGESDQKSFVSRMENFLSMLPVPCSWPMNELLWHHNHVELQNSLVGKFRATLHCGLSKPQLYLQNSPEAYPDLCHVYNLYHEHGKLISLHDWIKSYAASKGKNKISTLEHAKFIQSVSELHFLGYIKSTKRKTDHVAKMSLLGY